MDSSSSPAARDSHRRLPPETPTEAAAFAQAQTHGDNAFKPELGRRTLVRALLLAKQMEA